MNTTNPFFDQYSYGYQQRLTEDLLIESIKQAGHAAYYLPRTLENEIEVLGEDPASKFTSYFPLELYINSFEGFEGQGDFLSKFGVQLKDQIIFGISKRRFNEIRTSESIMDEMSYMLQLEDASIAQANTFSNIIIESSNVNFQHTRPMERRPDLPADDQ